MASLALPQISESSAGTNQQVSGPFVCLTVAPCITGPKYFRRDAIAFHWHVKSEQLVCTPFSCCQRSIVNGIDNRPRVLKAHSLASPIASSGPAGIDEPDLTSMFANPVSQQFGILGRMPHQKRRRKTGVKVAVGSVTFISVPATFAVYPLMK